MDLEAQNNPLVSVIIPTYNSEKYLIDSIASVLHQTYNNIEIIVVNDGSTDNTDDIIKPYLGSIKYIKQENYGASAARNIGIKNAHGNFIAFLDADDLFEPNVIKGQVENILNKNADISICLSLQVMMANYNAGGYIWPLKKDNYDINLCYKIITPPNTLLFKKRTIEEYLGDNWFDINLNGNEDHNFLLRCAANGFNFVNNINDIVIYRQHDNGISESSSRMNNTRLAVRKELSETLANPKYFQKSDKTNCWLAHAAGTLQDILYLDDFSSKIASEMIINFNESLYVIKNLRNIFNLKSKLFAYYSIKLVENYKKLIDCGIYFPTSVNNDINKLFPKYFNIDLTILSDLAQKMEKIFDCNDKIMHITANKAVKFLMQDHKT